MFCFTAYLAPEKKGLTQADFTRVCESESCQFHVTRENLAVNKFVNDLVKDPKNLTVVPENLVRLEIFFSLTIDRYVGDVSDNRPLDFRVSGDTRGHSVAPFPIVPYSPNTRIERPSLNFAQLEQNNSVHRTPIGLRKSQWDLTSSINEWFTEPAKFQDVSFDSATAFPAFPVVHHNH